MSYAVYFNSTDVTINHLAGVIAQCPPLVAMQYTGFAAVSAVTVYELAIKELFTEFGRKKHKTFGHFVDKHFKRLNGRIGLKDLREESLARFGDKYLNRFVRLLDIEEKNFLANHRASIKSNYGNLIVWRNSFAHEGKVPNNATFQEVQRSYENGKKVIECLAKTLVR
ncbi:HEPN domain-containing protein [Herbaspirillum sp. NPDC101397]|uniref:HEPN domain-containing protein n=1 Tax=Herbaspirillum sp. NPDC101397 TaxID=3364006 RepID=UPI003839F980